MAWPMHFISNIVYTKFLPTNLVKMYVCAVYTLLKLQTIINVYLGRLIHQLHVFDCNMP